MKIVDYIEDYIPSWALSYLVNGDASGLEDGEQAQVDEWQDDCIKRLMDTYPGCNPTFDIEKGEGHFCKSPAFGLACDCVKGAFFTMVREDAPWEEIELPDWVKATPDYEEPYNRIMESEVFRTDGPAIDLPAALIELANALHACPDDIKWELGECSEAPLSELIVGAYWALTECYGGQWSDSYAALCALGQVFSPGMTGPPDEDASERIAYDLVGEWFAAH